jgi:hypothetical protein
VDKEGVATDYSVGQIDWVDGLDGGQVLCLE